MENPSSPGVYQLTLRLELTEPHGWLDDMGTSLSKHGHNLNPVLAPPPGLGAHGTRPAGCRALERRDVRCSEQWLPGPTGIRSVQAELTGHGQGNLRFSHQPNRRTIPSSQGRYKDASDTNGPLRQCRVQGRLRPLNQTVPAPLGIAVAMSKGVKPGPDVGAPRGHPSLLDRNSAGAWWGVTNTFRLS